MRLLGISRIIVAVNKMDTVDWSQTRFEEICESMTAILKSINQTDNIFCPVSGLQGINVVPEVNPDENRDMKKIAPWYNGPTLLEIIGNQSFVLMLFFCLLLILKAVLYWHNAS